MTVPVKITRAERTLQDLRRMAAKPGGRVR